MSTSTTHRILRRILLVITFCSIGYGFTLLPGIVMEHTVKSHPIKVSPATEVDPVETAVDARSDKVDPLLPDAPATLQPVAVEKSLPSNILAVADTPENNKIIKSLQTVIDPELGINIVDLGLIREISRDKTSGLTITIIPTSPLCPYLKQLVAAIRQTVEHLALTDNVRVAIDMEHRWTPDNLSAAGRRHFFGGRP